MDFEITKTSLGQIKKGGHAIIKQRPCKIDDVKQSKTGKHGSMKVRLVGIDCINKNKYELMAPGHTPINTFKLVRKDYQLMNIIDNDDEPDVGIECICADSSTTTIYIKKSLHSTMDSLDKLKQLLKSSEKSIEMVIITTPVQTSDNKDVGNDEFSCEHAIESYKEQKE